MSKIKLIIACCNSFSRIGLCTVLRKEKDFRIMKEASNTEETIRYAQELNPDILLICMHLLLKEGNSVVARVKEKFNTGQIVLFNSSLDINQESSLIKDGIRGILHSNCSPKTLTKALRRVHAGELWLKRELVESLIISPVSREAINSGNGNLPLTGREKEILTYIADGYKNRAISSELCISEGTVKTHIKSIYRKLKINDRLQATFCAMQHNLLSK